MNHSNASSGIFFEWNSLLRDILRNFWMVMLAAAVGIMGLYIVEHSIYKPVYSSRATLIVRVKAGAAEAYTNLAASSEMAEIFTEVFVQPAMREYAAAALGEKEFNGEIAASVLPDTNMLTLSVTAEDPENAYRLLKSVLNIYPEISESVFSNAVIDIIQDPVIPRGPDNAVSSRNRMLVSVLCGAAMLAAIGLLSLWRDTVKNEAAYNAKIDAPLLGCISHERKHRGLRDWLLRKKRPLLISNAYASLLFAESYQKIATKLEYMNKNSGDKIFLITSVAENEGKSTVSANLALALAGRGHRTVLLDMDFKKPSQYKIFSVKYMENAELGELLKGKTEAKDYIFRRHRKSELFLGLNTKRDPDCQSQMHRKLFQAYLAHLKKTVDFIIIDTAPLLSAADSTSLMSAADRTILVVRTDCTYAASVNEAALMIGDVGGRLAGCVLNDVYREFSLFGQMGFDESGYYGRKYGAYKNYADYGKYSAFKWDAPEESVPGSDEHQEGRE